MVTNTTDAKIRSRVETFLQEMRSLVRQVALASVEDVLSGASDRRRAPGRRGATAKRRPGRPRKVVARARLAKRGKRTGEQVEALASRVLAHVKANPGDRLEQIGKGLRMATKELKLPIAKLLATKRVKTSGRKRGTKYFTGGRARSVSKPRRKSKSQVRRRAKPVKKSSRAKAGRRRTPTASVPAPTAAAA